MCNNVKYNSFLLGLILFNPIITLIGKLIGVGSTYTGSVFVILLSPCLLYLHKINYKLLIVPFIMIISLIFGYYLSSSSHVEIYFVNFIAFALIPLFVASFPYEEKYVLITLKYASIINFLLLTFLALARQDLYLDKDVMNYMTYGVWMLATAIVSLFLYIKTGNKLMMLTFILASIMILLFGNRFSLLIIFIGGLLIYAFQKGSYKFYFISFIAVGALVLSFNHMERILEFLIELFQVFDLKMVNLERLLFSIQSFENDDISGGRDVLFDTTINLIINNPFGLWIINGNQELANELSNSDAIVYPHNFLLEVFLHYGIILGIAILLFISWLIWVNLKMNKNLSSGLFLVLLVLSLPLLTSGTYLMFTNFWLMIAVGLNNYFDKDN